MYYAIVFLPLLVAIIAALIALAGARARYPGGPPDVRDSRDRTGEKADRHATGLRNRAYRDGKASAYPPFIQWRG